MSTRAIGTLALILPIDKVDEFESYFDEFEPKAFPNVEIELYETKDVVIGNKKYVARSYDLECSHSVYSCLIECSESLGYGFQDICKELDVQEVKLDAFQAEDDLSEQIILSRTGFEYMLNDGLEDKYLEAENE